MTLRKSNPELKRVLLIGGSGFIGTAIQLSAVGGCTEFIVVDKPMNFHTSQGGRFIPCDLSRVSDILDQDLIRSVDAVVYLAGVADIDEAESDPVKATALNVTVPCTIFRSLASTNPEKPFFYASSVYAAACPTGVYGNSKRTAELSLSAIAQEYDASLVVGRIGSAYGLQKNNINLVQRLIITALRREPISLPRPDLYSRNFIYITDVVAQIFHSIKFPTNFRSPFYIVGDQSMTYKCLVNAIESAINVDILLVDTKTRSESGKRYMRYHTPIHPIFETYEYVSIQAGIKLLASEIESSNFGVIYKNRFICEEKNSDQIQ